MTRKIKVLGVAFFAVLAFGAMSAISAPGASAAQFHCEKAPCLLTGEQEKENPEHFLVGANLTVSCELVKTDGTSGTATSNSITVTPTYGTEGGKKGCTSSVGAAQVRVNHCGYEFAAETTGEHAKVTVECANVGEAIEIETGGCTVLVGPQTVKKGGVRYLNQTVGGIKHVTVNITAEEVAYTKKGLTCGFVSGEAKHTGSETVTCEEDKDAAAKTGTEKTTPGTTTAGARVGCFWE
jgi:hypothetical protein